MSLLLILSLGPLIVLAGPSSFTHDSVKVDPNETAMDLIERSGRTLQEYQEWARASEGKVLELQSDTTFFHRNRKNRLRRAHIKVDKDQPISQETWVQYYHQSMKGHWDYHGYGWRNVYGTGLYLHADPLGAQEYGPNVMEVTLPKGTRLFVGDFYTYFTPRVHECEPGLGEALSGVQDAWNYHCRLWAKAKLRSLGVQAVAYAYGNQYDCAERKAILLVDEINPVQIQGFSEYEPQPLYLKRDGVHFNRYWGRDREFRSRVLGCGAKVREIQPRVDFRYPNPPYEPCVHSQTSPLKNPDLGSMIQALRDLF